ncbi:cell wall-binding repeat-containing protein [Microbacterium sp. NPDC089318]
MPASIRRPAIAAAATIAALSLSLPLAASGADEPELPQVEAPAGDTGSLLAPHFRDAPADAVGNVAPLRSDSSSTALAALPGPVERISNIEVHSTGALISWQQPAADPVVTGYRLQLLLDGAVIDEATWGQETSAWIDGLDPDTEYGVRIAATSDSGTGELSAVHTFTTTHNSVQRIFGTDRYETSVRISQDAFLYSGIQAAFVANGRDFPDALSAAAAAGALGGPVLLTRPTSVGSSTLDELDALDPGYVLVAGGKSVVSETVYTKVADLAIDGAFRYAGANRYDTAAQISLTLGEAPVVYLASGTNFPDALAGAAAAGNAGAPVLLTRPDSLPAETADALRELKPSQIVALGGVGAVSAKALDAADRATGVATTTRRLAGASRYDTAVKVSADAFRSSRTPVLYVASGRNFADALSAAAAGGTLGGPVLLTYPDSVPDSVLAEIDRLDPVRVIVLGGPTVIADSVLQRISGVLAD